MCFSFRNFVKISGCFARPSKVAGTQLAESISAYCTISSKVFAVACSGGPRTVVMLLKHVSVMPAAIPALATIGQAK